MKFNKKKFHFSGYKWSVYNIALITSFLLTAEVWISASAVVQGKGSKEIYLGG